MKEYKQDAKGNLVPLANIKEIDLLRDELVLEIAAKARAVQDDLITFKRAAMDDIAAFVQLRLKVQIILWHLAPPLLLKAWW